MTRVLVTGAKGSIGVPLVQRLEAAGDQVWASDIEDLDVTDPDAVRVALHDYQAEIVYHLAADKHAPHGEEDPAYTALLNISGTENVLTYAGDAKVVLASTCKACDPETAYGASKLIAERMVLNAGGVVARLFNVRDTSGNVFRLWEQIPLAEPIPYTDCRRYFISLERAVALMLQAPALPCGRYTVDPGESVHMGVEAARLYPGRQFVEVPRRRGDRRIEPLCATSERMDPINGLLRVWSPHDPIPVESAVAA